MKIWYSPYQLYPKGNLNSQVKVRYRKGALLRFRFDDGLIGYSDLCPFSEMGDRPLEFELRHLALTKPTLIGERATYYAQIDAQARKDKVSLFNLPNKIRNHFLITDLLKFDLERVGKLESEGYSEFKIKMGRELNSETSHLEKLTNRLSNKSRIRIDFNGSFNQERFAEWFDKCQGWLRPCLEFIEDPFTYNVKTWRQESQKRNVIFALDQLADPIETQAEGADVIVIKPVVQDAQAITAAFGNTNKKFVMTHNMDFPLGQMQAFYSALVAKEKLGDRLLTCGLQHHDIYEGFTFQNEIRCDGPYVIPPAGTGFGFDHLLAKQNWSELK